MSDEIKNENTGLDMDTAPVILEEEEAKAASQTFEPTAPATPIPPTEEKAADDSGEGFEIVIEDLEEEPVEEPVRTRPVQNPDPDTYSYRNPNASWVYTQQDIPPYGGKSGSDRQGGGWDADIDSSKSPKKERKGLKRLLAFVAVAVIVGLLISNITLLKKNRSIEIGEGTTGATASADAPVLETKPSPTSPSTAKAGSVLTPTQIAAKVRESSVGILVYSAKSSSAISEGSGVLWKEDNSHTYTYIITCAHVIEGSNQTYTVQTEDGKTYDAEMVGADAKTDLGVLRIKAKGLKLAEFGDSGALQVGDPVYAIGNPGGTEFFGSFTSGIVSAIDRSVKSTYTMICIQHTAAINPGNSGGALVNQYGQVIGINSQKIISSEYEGMGFAIPIKSAQPIIDSLSAYGYIKDRPRLGITYAEAVNYQQYSMIIKIKGLPSGSLIIASIDDDGALADTEARQYDMIVAVNGQKMTTPNVLLDKIENGKVGDKLRLTLCRIDNNYQTKEFDITVTLVEDKKEKTEETTTVPQGGINPYDFFDDDFFNGLF